MNCRHCKRELHHVFLDLAFAPPSNAYLSEDQLKAPEITYPLKLHVCDSCWLVQTEDYAGADQLFADDYAYFSSTSDSWLQHASRYCSMISARLGLDTGSFVIEVASNDGYLLRNFVSAQVPCLGIEPTRSTADAAEKLGIPVMREFFGAATARRLVAEGRTADLICGNNVYAHVPDINDFTEGLRIALKRGGTVNLEFPHLMRLIGQNQFDTVYHEHFSYLSANTVNQIFAAAGLRLFDVEELPTHGGSLRVYGCHADDARPTTDAVLRLLAQESAFGLCDLAIYQEFQARADRVKDNLLQFLLEQKRSGRRVAAYGAAAKGNTLMNYAGIRSDLVRFVCDAAPSKQGRFMPGNHLAILPPTALEQERPDWVLILPWNIADEVTRQQDGIRSWGGRFVVAVPELRVLP